MCQVCHRFCGSWLCARCRAGLRPSPERLLPSGIRVVPAFEHTGPARALAHHLKYRGLVAYAVIVADMLADRVPRAPIVPVPRAWSRYLRYGIDPALTLAERLSSRTGMPVVRALAAPWHSRRRAGGDHDLPVRRYGLRNSVLETAVLIDDVITTGATLEAAVNSIGPDRVRAVAAANAVSAVPATATRHPADRDGIG